MRDLEDYNERSDTDNKIKEGEACIFILAHPVFAGAGIYLEVLFHLAIYHKLESTSIYPILFGATLGLFLAALTVWLPRIGNEIMRMSVLRHSACMISCSSSISGYLGHS